MTPGDQKETILQMFADGDSALRIGRVLGFTKNQVAGVLHRAGAKRQRKGLGGRPKKAKAKPLASGLRCAWPVDNPKAKLGFDFSCPADATRGPYCIAHGERAYLGASHAG